jgi:hypothetical protein
MEVQQVWGPVPVQGTYRPVPSRLVDADQEWKMNDHIPNADEEAVLASYVQKDHEAAEALASHFDIKRDIDGRPAKFGMEVKFNSQWHWQGFTDSLTELAHNVQIALSENGPDSVRIYVLVHVSSPVSEEELEDLGIIPGNHRPGDPNPDRIPEGKLVNGIHGGPFAQQKYPVEAPRKPENPWRGIKGHPMNDEPNRGL